MRNRGRSSRVTDPAKLTLEADVRDLEAIRRHAGAERFATIGYSYLGKMVVLYALEYPESVSRIVQIGPVGMRFGSPLPAVWDASGEEVMDPKGVAAVRKLRAEGWVESRPQEYCEREWLVTRVRLVGDPENAEDLSSLCHLPNEWPSRLAFHLQHHFRSARETHVDAIDLAALEVPVLTVHGTRDRNAAYGGGREWAAVLPNGRLLTVEGGAHQAWQDDERVIPAIREFLAGSWPEGAEDLEMGSEGWLSQMRAHELLTQALALHRSDAAEPAAIRVRWKGTLFPRSQSRSSQPPFDPFPYRESAALSRDTSAISIDQELTWPNFVGRYRVVAQGRGGFDLNLASKREIPRSESSAKTRIALLARLPALLIEEALRHPDALRLLGIRREEGVPLRLVEARAAASRVTLVLDRDLRLREVRRLDSEPLLGDVLVETELSGGREVAGLRLPARIRSRANGVLQSELELEGAEPIDAAELEAALVRPEGFAPPASPETAPIAIEPLAPAVWLVRNIGGSDYSSLVVEKGDELLLVEAPVDAPSMERVLDLLEERFPGKGVRTVVVTHHHFDHSGGVLAPMRAGAAVVTTPGNAAFFRSVAAASRTLSGGGGAPAAIRTVDGPSLVIEGDGPRVELHRLDGSGHADEMLYAWLPRERILFQGDLFVLHPDAPEAARPQAIALARQIDRQELPVERLVGVHGAIASLDDLRAAVRRAREGTGD